MNYYERQEYMKKADSLAELLSYACDVSVEEGRKLEARIDKLEDFFENHGHSQSKPWKMAVLYVMMRHGHSVRTVEKWWGEPESSYYSFSAQSGKQYLKDIKEIINEKVDHDKDANWTPGDKAYEKRQDPLDEYFDIEKDEGTNADLSSFT